jgi:type II secretory pathway pseudopilin PulG
MPWYVWVMVVLAMLCFLAMALAPAMLRWLQRQEQNKRR